jgi:phosphocarrier protein
MSVDKIFTNLKGLSFLICTMNKSDNRLSKSVTIINDLGLHARSAAQIAKLAQNVKSKVWIIKDEEKVDAASIIDILTLACAKGSKITLKIDDQSDLDILNNIAKLIESGFGE